jgi:hypothetical protein
MCDEINESLVGTDPKQEEAISMRENGFYHWGINKDLPK